MVDAKLDGAAAVDRRQADTRVEKLMSWFNYLVLVVVVVVVVVPRWFEGVEGRSRGIGHEKDKGLGER